MTGWIAVVAYSAVWMAAGLVTGWVGSKVPGRWLTRDRGPLRLGRFEARGRYERWLRIKGWKDHLPEAGGWFGGTSKARLLSWDADGLVALALASRRAEWVHWANVAVGATFFAWNPWEIGVVMLLFGLAAHGPFIAVQRYNRLRLVRVLGRHATRVRRAVRL